MRAPFIMPNTSSIISELSKPQTGIAQFGDGVYEKARGFLALRTSI
jgi:hypothetical protein